MVQVKYKGQNFLVFGKTKIVNGFNEILDDQFYELMIYKTFSSRVVSGVLGVPQDFSIYKKEKKVNQKSNIENVSEDKKILDSISALDELSFRDAIEFINLTDNIEYLKSIIENETRKKVLLAAENRLNDLNNLKK